MEPSQYGDFRGVDTDYKVATTDQPTPDFSDFFF